MLLRIDEDRVPVVFYRDNGADLQVDSHDVVATAIAEARAQESGGTSLSREPIRSASFLTAETAHRASAHLFLDVDARADQGNDPMPSA